MKKLTKELVKKNEAPVKVLQFGEGNFMRGFIDWKIQQLNNQQLFKGNVAIIQPLEQGLGNMMNQQDNLYTVILQGLSNGEIVDTSEIITVVEQMINPYDEWDAYLSLAENDDLAYIVSNTTEAGIQFVETDNLTDTPPQSFPGKLTAFLYRRFKLNKAGFTIIPCELIDRNGERLKEIILRYAEKWDLEPAFVEWLEKENVFCCSLVDRIVPGYPREDAGVFNQRHNYEDQLMVKAEPFMLWVIEGPKELENQLPFKQAGLNVIITDDMTPYRERKVHLLNGPHTAMVPLALLAELETVEEVMKDPLFSAYVDQLFNLELIPMLSLPKDELAIYADQIKERFLNPFAHHKLEAISLNSVSKFSTRLLPVFKKYIEEQNQVPPLITVSLAALLLMYRGDQVKPHDDEKTISEFTDAWSDNGTAIPRLLQNAALWGEDLSQIPNVTDTVQEIAAKIDQKGVRSVLQEMKGTMVHA
ncbi:TPA: tagaturonate reductase [Enterococcus faecium]